MKQILQDVSSGTLSLSEVPPPQLQPGGVLIRTAASLISAGTEKMIIDLAKKSLVGKARARPDLVSQVVAKARKEGLANTYRAVRSRMERPMPLGYSAAGIVEAVAEDVSEFRVGDRVAMAGGGYATHAELNFVPKNLVALMPEGVSFAAAAYTTVGSIALQGVRVARPELGDNVVVIGLGLLGLISVQLLKANGCRVVGFDIDPSKVDLALKSGADHAVAGANDLADVVSQATEGRGADHVLITAATSSSEPIALAGEVARRKARIVAVGAVGLEIPRDVYYKKELEVLMSMSYGPGRYDASYEEGGHDYPYEYVRWTENRNMGAFLSLLAQGRLDLDSLTTHSFDFEESPAAYQLIESRREPYVGIILEYDTDKPQSAIITISDSPVARPSKESIRVGLVGAGNYASLHIIPHLAGNPIVELGGIVTATGLSARQKADKFGFSYCTTDYDALLDDESIDAVFIATKHATHSEFAIRALRAGKHVFVEKPLSVSSAQLEDVRRAYSDAAAIRPTGLMVGLNRRFSPLVDELMSQLPSGAPRQMIYRVNSGHIPADSWMHAREEGGGMLVGEMCHFLDLMQFLAGEQPAKVYAHPMSIRRADIHDHDNLTIVVAYDGGSVGTLCYNTIGDKAAPKERLEVYSQGLTAFLDDFRELRVARNGKLTKKRLRNQDKGQSHQIRQTIELFAASGGAPIPFEQLYSVMQAVFAAQSSLAGGQAVEMEHVIRVDPTGVPVG